MDEETDDVMYEENDDTDLPLEFESDEESGSDSDDDNELYDDAMYGPKRLKLEDESVRLSEEQKKAVLKLKKNKKRWGFLVAF